MTSTARPSVASVGCLRVLRTFFINDGLLATRRQTRGKKYIVKEPPTVKVKLLEDIKGYGARGSSVIPVKPGRMRNIWYPAKMARYMTQAQLQHRGDKATERDFNFGYTKEEIGAAGTIPVSERQTTSATSVKLLKSEVAFSILSDLLPASITFFRTPLVPQTVRTLHDKASSKTPSEDNLQEAAIYGSVTRTDMANSMRVLLSENEQGARIVLGAEEITIIARQGRNFGVEPDRVKALGNFTIEVRIKGEEPIRRTVSVKEQAKEEAKEEAKET